MVQIREYDRGFLAGYRAGLAASLGSSPVEAFTFPVAPQVPSDSARVAARVAAPTPKKRKVSAYNRRYSAAYKRLRRKATLKNGTLRKGVTHKTLVKAAHKEAKRGGKK